MCGTKYMVVSFQGISLNTTGIPNWYCNCLIFSPKISSTAQRMELNITPRLFTQYKARIDAIKNIMDSWGVGHAECNNGIVLFVSRGDRVMHIATGFFL